MKLGDVVLIVTSNPPIGDLFSDSFRTAGDDCFLAAEGRAGRDRRDDGS
jgi:hypothetical protein